MSLLLDNVSYNYPGSTHGLHEVSLDVRTGELVAVIGPSGSGKSTLLKLVSGLETGHTGRIALDGEDMSRTPVHQRHIGMVFQSYALFPHLSVLDNVAYGLKLRKVAAVERRKRAQELLDVVGLGEYAQRAVAQLSGGQQQRVALARALAIDPRALLLDEPLSALDASVRGHLRDQIRSIQQRFDATTLLVTHDQEEALVMADRVAMLKDGRLLQIATPREIYENPASRAVAEFVGLSTILPAKVGAPDRLDLGFAELAAPTGSRTAGSAVHVLVRPEHIQADPPAGSINRLAGRTGAQRYLGALTRYDFEVAGAGKPFLAESATPAAEAIAIAPEHLRLLDH
ncbi:putative spermidine/putrescine transport system ATP-binding protein [Variovorax paradoxus]|uniref:ABC transporter ATP-binding protein n=1 Tax=Variovorax TaxID=34072 RepID=UPI001780630D|nr:MULTISPECIES: ABC transporter ATP-binding protein [Variovorax]MBD9666773.1 ABC transporter ATP-binding protein [Variovorax sp. VRV01]MDP9968322.1 putative spermidine/putrescine transport system ATP-binding protein [Variovorax paradoxus]MDR6456823.1 putative spermidine/putrescine transport system ATP-binding protein [Variovorax paradoxus]